MRRRLVLLLALSALPACATRYTGVSGALKLGATPEENLQRGEAEMKDKNYPEAIRFFEYVKAKYPFSSVSAKADLRLSDIKFEQGRYVEAAEGYEKFAKDHPSSDQLDLALYRAGLSHYKASPSDFILFPPAYEKDMRETEKARDALREYVKARPGSPYLADAQKALTQAEELLAKRELYVGDFYFKRDDYPGAAARYKSLVEGYPATPQAGPAQLKLAEAYIRMKETFQARQALQRLIAQRPDGPERSKAEKLLESLR